MTQLGDAQRCLEKWFVEISFGSMFLNIPQTSVSKSITSKTISSAGLAAVVMNL
jgi:hypothetical protein